MGKRRERENPCAICGHYHRYYEGEVCEICGHQAPVSTANSGQQYLSAFPTEILPGFLYLGSFDNASRTELLKSIGISRLLNTVSGCRNLCKESFFTYHHCQTEEKALPFDDAIQFIEKCEKEKARVLVHCMSGKKRSPAIVIGYLMKSKGWRLAQSYEWVKDKRKSVELPPEVYQQLQEFEQKIFGPVENNPAPFGFGFGFASTYNKVAAPAFGNLNSTSIFDNVALNIPPQGFIFGATSAPPANDDHYSMQG